MLYFQWQRSKLIAANIVNRPWPCVVVEWLGNVEPFHVGIDMQVLPAEKLFVQGPAASATVR